MLRAINNGSEVGLFEMSEYVFWTYGGFAYVKLLDRYTGLGYFAKAKPWLV